MTEVKEQIRTAKRLTRNRRKDIFQVEKAGRELSRIGKPRSALVRGLRKLRKRNGA